MLSGFANQTIAEGFRGGDSWFDLSNSGVGLADGQMSDELREEIELYTAKIVSGEITVPDKPE